MSFGMATQGRHGMALVGSYGMRGSGVWRLKFQGKAFFQVFSAVKLLVNWGDGQVELLGPGSYTKTHEYSDENEYDVIIGGESLGFSFSNSDSLEALVEIVNPAPFNLVKTVPSSMFNNNRALRSLPKGLFSGLSPANLFRFFNNCFLLEGIPEDFCLVSNVTSIQEMCFNCAELKTIGSGVFDNMPKLTNATRAFYGTRFPSLPSGIFASTPELASCSQMFIFSRELLSIPAGMLADVPKLTQAGGAFRFCDELEGVPSGIFANADLSCNLDFAFSDCPSVIGSIPALWDRYGGSNACYFNCGSELTAPPSWTHSVSNICAAACAGWTGGQWTGEDYCNCS